MVKSSTTKFSVTFYIDSSTTNITKKNLLTPDITMKIKEKFDVGVIKVNNWTPNVKIVSCGKTIKDTENE